MVCFWAPWHVCAEVWQTTIIYYFFFSREQPLTLFPGEKKMLEKGQWGKQTMLEGGEALCFACAPKMVDRDKASQGSTWTEKASLHPGGLNTVSKDHGWMASWIPQSASPNLDASNQPVRVHPMNSCLVVLCFLLTNTLFQASKLSANVLEGPDQWDEDFLLSL